jgi:hypothetical protein
MARFEMVRDGFGSGLGWDGQQTYLDMEDTLSGIMELIGRPQRCCQTEIFFSQNQQY